MDDTESDRGEYGAGGESATAALERVTDPVVSVDDGSITYANAAAREEMDLPDDVGGSPASVLESWGTLEREITETAAGTDRIVELGDERYDARVHRGTDGATITFEPADELPSLERDRWVKDRAINEAPVGVAITDPSMADNPLVYINEAFGAITGYDRETVVGRNCRFLQGPDTDPAAVDAMREAIADERPVTVELENYRQDGTRFWNEVTLAPVHDDHGEVTNFVGFQNDVTARKRAEIALQERTDELERLLERVEGLVQDVTGVVAGSTSRSALEADVCERIAAESAYDGAWIGEHNPATNTLEVRASAGVAVEDVAMDADHPATRAIDGQAVRLGTVDGMEHAGFPLTHNDVEYGVLTVCAREENAIDEREEVVLSALARAVASGINARETSRILETDDVVVVECDVTDRAVAPVALSADAACTLEYNRSVHRLEGDTASLYTVTGASADELGAAASALDGVDVRPVVEREGREELLVELGTDEPGLVEWLSTRGAVTRSIRAADGTARVRLELPQSANVRATVEALEKRHPGTDVVSFRQRERPDETRQEFAARLEADLTDRQLAALRRAYLGGYFEWPRPATGEELAQSMNISRPTFHEHLRTAEAKLCRALFEEPARDN
ncbi:bacterio-opsin activator domain-containing protein [Halomontanus rarus]|uniref:bacterio-opsin activator domain-containing protein n=1 Tax=Halomontanus rarus TaxID=3034020 RepID=UPI0023E75C59|nr:bacterio-opsin activator domain-containing protein [Halovivax sp. TS33]